MLLRKLNFKVTTSVVQIGHRYGMTLFIASEVMFLLLGFGLILMQAYFAEAVGATLLPPDIKTFDPWDIPLITTLILFWDNSNLGTSCYVENDRKDL